MKKMYALLEHHCDIPMQWLQSAFAKLGQRVAQEIAAKGVAGGVRAACRVAGDIAGAAVARTALRTVIAEATDGIAIAGYLSTIRAVSLTTGTTFAFVASAVIEIPFFVRGVYKLHRKKKFNQIDEVAFKKGFAKQISVSAGAIIGGTAGAFGGLFIPVPAVGSMLTGAAGSLVGITVGHVVGYGIGSTFKEGMVPDFVIVRKHLYTDFP